MLEAVLTATTTSSTATATSKEHTPASLFLPIGTFPGGERLSEEMYHYAKEALEIFIGITFIGLGLFFIALAVQLAVVHH